MNQDISIGDFDINIHARAAEAASRSIPPAWPLHANVAVNPYLGQTTEPLATAGARLGRVAGARVTMPRSWYAERIAKGVILDEDLEAARKSSAPGYRPKSVAELKEAVRRQSPTPEAAPTIADLAVPHLDLECSELIADRIGLWAAGYFDLGQALWKAGREGGAYRQWRSFATRDLTPGILGVKNFAAHVDGSPETALGAIARASERLGLRENELPTYFHALLMSLGGWAQLARYELWQAELAGETDTTVTDFLAIRMVWEEALFELCGDAIAKEWARARAAHGSLVEPTADLAIDAILQEAAERAEQRRLGVALAAQVDLSEPGRPDLQAAFCIDVRSEVYRRALEATHPGIRTLGFAGFFGLPSGHHRFASDTQERRLPVLLNPALGSRADGDAQEDREARYVARAKRAWGRFKLAAVSSFAFVESAAPIYVSKLWRDALGVVGAHKRKEPRPVFDPMPDLETRIDMAATVLRAMSLTREFAPVVLLVGHGAKVVNNPHASALHCGACGGYSGEVNARLLAGLLNDADVRLGLAAKGIEIPKDTLFVAALHETTTDDVTLFDEDAPDHDHTERLAQAREWLARASQVASAERALKLPRARHREDVLRRSRDWSEVRPEWALAGCKAFIAAPRCRTSGKSFEGRAFLHDYDWNRDEGFSVLELIMTAPVVVASWISLQYYGSSVSPEVFGGGNKLLHNVTGGIGVVEGNGGRLRVGLPWQSVHDGEKLIHDPLRLTVCIEAPREAMTAILKRNDSVRALFDHRWLHLFALNELGEMAWRYTGNLEWEATNYVGAPANARVA